MTLRIASNATPAAEWDAFVRQAAGGTACHWAGWRQVMERVFGHECHYLEARGPDGALAGVLPLVGVRSMLFGRYLVSMPYLNYGGPLGSEAAVRALADRAAGMAEAGRVRRLELRSRIALPLALEASHRKITVVLDLAGDSDAVFKGFDAKLRSQIRRPKKEGVEIRFGHDQVEPFYRVFSQHMRDLGTPVMPRAWFEAIAETFGDAAWFGCAWLGAEPVACGAGFRWGNEVEITWAAALRAHSRIAPNMALYWAFIERAVLDGARAFNFGRCTPGSSTHRFKRQWGTRDESLWWYGASRQGAPAATPSPSDGAYAWGPRIWRRLPERVATVLGPRIVRGIP
ncbi:MAG TPA: FemAB family XrtA/PEP-CTERM system-associated protein [Gemmatimonadaceae bacterium]|nr:FemAB family XrtA/PEP-CTERM system-associated protein [Gemmatimonadaceae bacterium]